MYGSVKPSRRIFILWAAIVLLIAAVLSLALQDGSQIATFSESVILKMVDNIQPGFRDMNPAQQMLVVDIYGYAVRKIGHVIVFIVLGALSMAVMFEYSVSRKVRIRAALAICVGFAVADELRQVFMSGRSGLISDVIIDIAGSLLGIGCILLFCRRRRKHCGMPEQEAGSPDRQSRIN